MHAISLASLAVALLLLVVAWVRKIPIVMGMTVANFAVFVLGATTGRRGTLDGSPLMGDLAAKVAYFSADQWPHLYTIFTATFLHANVAHLIGNMLTLLLIGVPFEDRVGRGRFVAIYFGTAVVAVVLHSLWIVTQGAPGAVDVYVVGASGAVFGVLGAFATMYPRDKVYVPIVMIVRIPVIFAAIILATLQGFYLFSGALGNVAYAAHIGGAVGGVFFGLLLKPKANLDQGEAKAIDYATLDRLANQADQRRLIEKLRQNEDHPETQRAWLERLLPTLVCPTCGSAFAKERRGTLVCTQGHKESYAR